MKKPGKVAALVGVAALVAAPVSGAKPDGSHGHGPKAKAVSYVFKGTYVDSTHVDVAKGNSRVRKAGLTGPIEFDFSAAKISVADVNLDGAADLGDVAPGDAVVVKVRAPKADPGPQPFVARQLVDQASPVLD